MSKLQNLQKALNNSTQKPVKAEAPAAKTPTPAAASYTAPSRAGKVNITAYLHPDFKSNLRLVQARRGGNVSIQTLLEESLNDLFTKYDVPSIRS